MGWQHYPQERESRNSRVLGLKLEGETNWQRRTRVGHRLVVQRWRLDVHRDERADSGLLLDFLSRCRVFRLLFCRSKDKGGFPGGGRPIRGQLGAVGVEMALLSTIETKAFCSSPVFFSLRERSARFRFCGSSGIWARTSGICWRVGGTRCCR